MINEDNKNNDEDNDEDKKPKEIKYRIKFIDSCRFMQDSLSNLVDNLSEVRICEIPNSILIKRFQNIYQLSDKFKLLLRNGVYPYAYMDGQKNLKKNHYQIKSIFTVNLIKNKSQM